MSDEEYVKLTWSQIPMEEKMRRAKLRYEAHVAHYNKSVPGYWDANPEIHALYRERAMSDHSRARAEWKWKQRFAQPPASPAEKETKI